VILDFAKEEHKTEEYRKLNPNGRIPTLVDHSNNDEVVWESNAILKYIAERFDKEKKFLVTDEKEKADLDTCEPLFPCFPPFSHSVNRALLPSFSSGPHVWQLPVVHVLPHRAPPLCHYPVRELTLFLSVSDLAQVPR